MLENPQTLPHASPLAVNLWGSGVTLLRIDPWVSSPASPVEPSAAQGHFSPNLALFRGGWTVECRH